MLLICSINQGIWDWIINRRNRMKKGIENRKPSRNEMYETLVTSVKYQSIEDRLARLRKNSSVGNLQREDLYVGRKERLETQPSVPSRQVRMNRSHIRQSSEIDFERYLRESESNRCQKPDPKPFIEPIRRKKYEYTRSNDITITPERTPCSSTPKETTKHDQNLNQRNFLRKKREQ